MPKKNTIHIVECDDRAGLYINNKLVFEDHSIPTKTLSKILNENKPTKDIVHIAADPDWMYEVGTLPDNLKDVVHDSHNE
jgi:hypothetical protein